MIDGLEQCKMSKEILIVLCIHCYFALHAFKKRVGSHPVIPYVISSLAVPSLAKVAETWYDIGLLIEALVNPTSDHA